jgi:heme oxygenase
MQITTSWQEQGRAEGQELEARGLVVKLLTRKFGNLSPKILTRLDVLKLESLEYLGEALLNFTSIDDLDNWFDAI